MLNSEPATCNHVLMLTWLKIGARNLLKNRRRSAFTVGAVALGFAAVNLFGGFTAYVYKGIEDGFIYAHANGHLTIYKEGFLTRGAQDPTAYLLTESELKTIRDVCRSDPRIKLVTPQLRIAGMISNGRASVIVMGYGRVPSDEAFIRKQVGGFVALLRPFDGQALRDDVVTEIGVSHELAKKMGFDLGSDAILVAPTVDGQMNALDANIVQFVDSPDEVLSDKIVAVPLGFAQLLYNTTSADRMTVLLNKTQETLTVRTQLQERLARAGVKADVRTWQEMRVSYFKIHDMFNVIFLFIFVIVFVIVLLSVVNTVSMAVLERTREIGTLRALGLKRRGVLIMFAAESAILAVLGSAVGFLVTVGCCAILDWVQPTWIPPTVTRRIPLQVFLVPGYLVLAFVCLMVLAVGAAVVPARRAARTRIVDALGHI